MPSSKRYVLRKNLLEVLFVAHQLSNFLLSTHGFTTLAGMKSSTPSVGKFHPDFMGRKVEIIHDFNIQVLDGEFKTKLNGCKDAQPEISLVDSKLPKLKDKEITVNLSKDLNNSATNMNINSTKVISNINNQTCSVLTISETSDQTTPEKTNISVRSTIVTELLSIEQFNSLLTGLQACGYPYPKKRMNAQVAFMKRMNGETVDDEEQHIKGIDNSRQVILKVGADWCRACNFLTPKFSKLSQQYEDIHFASLKTQDIPELLKDLKVKSIPSFLFFKGGHLIEQKNMKTSKQVEEFIKYHQVQTNATNACLTSAQSSQTKVDRAKTPLSRPRMPETEQPDAVEVDYMNQSVVAVKDTVPDVDLISVAEVFSIEELNSLLTGLPEPVRYPYPKKKINAQIVFMKKMRGEEVEETEEVIEGIDESRKVILKVGADWCRACNFLAPKFSTLSKKYKNIYFATLKTQDVPELMKDLKIKSIPSFLFFKGGEVVGQKCMKTSKQVEEFITLHDSNVE